MSDEYFELPCGCKFKKFSDKKIDLGDGIPSIEIDYYNINERCPIVYELLASGKTVGVFQIEKGWTGNWSKRLQPINISEISDLIAIIRPGCTKSKLDNKSMTEHFVDRKHFLEDYVSIDESIKDITDTTYSIIVYQEQAMKIAQAVAGFNLQQSDNLRKAIGKKDAKLMAKTRIEFIEGCKKTGIINEEKANEIFDIIEKSNRYSFNHCISPDTIVETENNFTTINDINIGDKIFNHKSELVEVTDKIDTGIQHLYEVTLENNKTIKCTIEHKFLCENGQILPLYEIIEKSLKIACSDEE